MADKKSRKDHFWVHKELSKSQYTFEANVNKDQNQTHMSVKFEFNHLGIFIDRVFEKYCKSQSLDIKKTGWSTERKVYTFADIEIVLDISRKKNRTGVSFTRRYQQDQLTRKDFRYFKNTADLFMRFISQYNKEGSRLSSFFQNTQYTGLVEIIEKEKDYDQLLYEEMAFLLRNKDDPKKVKIGVHYIRKYAKKAKFNPESFLKKELGKDYFT